MRAHDDVIIKFMRKVIRQSRTPVVTIIPEAIRTSGSEVAEWLAHWLLVLEVPGSIPASAEENLLIRTCFPSCHLQE